MLLVLHVVKWSAREEHFKSAIAGVEERIRFLSRIDFVFPGILLSWSTLVNSLLW